MCGAIATWAGIVVASGGPAGFFASYEEYLQNTAEFANVIGVIWPVMGCGLVMSDRICLVVTTEGTVRVFLAAHLRALQSEYDVTVVANVTNPELLGNIGVRGTLVPVSLERRIAPWRAT